MIAYFCRYAPVELFEAMGAGPYCALGKELEGCACADELHRNLCSFARSVAAELYDNGPMDVFGVNCCDSLKRVCDEGGGGRFGYRFMADLPKVQGKHASGLYAAELKRFVYEYSEHSGKPGDSVYQDTCARLAEIIRRLVADRGAGTDASVTDVPHIAIIGGKIKQELYDLAADMSSLPVADHTCRVKERVWTAEDAKNASDALRPAGEAGRDADGGADGTAPISAEGADRLMEWYAGRLLAQTPCMRMLDTSGRAEYINENTVGIIYHTVKFCDFYGFEYARLREKAGVPLLKIESDYTAGAAEQLSTRIEAFLESLGARRRESGGGRVRSENGGAERGSAGCGAAENTDGENRMGLYLGLDSGSTSVNAVVMDAERNIVAAAMTRTGARAEESANAVVAEVLKKAGVSEKDIAAAVTTGYGRRTVIPDADIVNMRSVTEITCHARGAHYLAPETRTVIDIGGQDSKVIRIDENGSVVDFAMNDKCAAGTGKFLELMARTMEIDLAEFATLGLESTEELTMSSMCTVFAESEVIGLIANNKDKRDIINAINNAITSRLTGMVNRLHGVPDFFLSGGVSRNEGVRKTLEKRLNADIKVSEYSQYCGAIGAALIAMEN